MKSEDSSKAIIIVLVVLVMGIIGCAVTVGICYSRRKRSKTAKVADSRSLISTLIGHNLRFGADEDINSKLGEFQKKMALQEIAKSQIVAIAQQSEANLLKNDVENLYKSIMDSQEFGMKHDQGPSGKTPDETIFDFPVAENTNLVVAVDSEY